MKYEPVARISSFQTLQAHQAARNLVPPVPKPFKVKDSTVNFIG
jgi:hypothetical protein